METQEKKEASNLMAHCEALETHRKSLEAQKTALETKLADLSKDNDTLKAKFSSLLDQF